MNEYKQEKPGYFKKLALATTIVLAPKIAHAQDELGKQINKFAEGVGVIINKGWNYGTIDQRWKEKNRKLNDGVEDVVLWPVRMGCDAVKTGGAIGTDLYNLPGEAMRRAQRIKAEEYARRRPKPKKDGPLEGIGNLLGNVVELAQDSTRYATQVLVVVGEGATRYAIGTVKYAFENPIDATATTASWGATIDAIVEANEGGVARKGVIPPDFPWKPK